MPKKKKQGYKKKQRRLSEAMHLASKKPVISNKAIAIKSTGYTASRNIAELRKAAAGLKPIIRIGKSGLKPTIVDETKALLKKNGIVKLKVLKNFIEENSKKGFAELTQELKEKTRPDICFTIGFNIVAANSSSFKATKKKMQHK